MRKKESTSFIALFAGCGGLSLGMESASEVRASIGKRL